MATTKQHSPLAKATVSPNVDVIQIVYPDIFAYPSMAANTQTPWIFDIDARLNYHSLSHRSSKGSQ
jgi:hypothetical protein